MAIPLERFIQQIEETGIIAGDTLKEFIPPKGTSKDAEGLARELVRQKKLTKYQAEEVYRGNGRSLTLGNYILMEKIGAGGMGQVFKAQHRRMKRIVAIKLLPAAMTKDKEAIARFEREVEAAAKISHPNIVAAFDADCANGVHFLVMELVEGKDLSALVKKNGPLSVGKTIIYILQAAKGLEAAHKKGIVHRDIKPANLLLDSEGTVKILDMGLARLNGEADAPAQAELTSTGTVMGTVDYMAPEQALNTKTADARADIYALGCTLWYLLTGKSTYEGDTLMAKLLAHRDQPIPSLRSASADIPEQLDAVFRKMVAKKTEDRYQNMTQLIAELQRCRHGDDSTVIGRDVVLPPAEPDMMDFLRDPSATQPASAKKTSTVTQSLMKKAAGKTPIGNDKKKLLIGGGILALFILLTGIVVSLKTKDGTLVVTVSEADANVQVLNEAGQVEVTRKGEKGPITIAVDPGKHRLKVTKEGFEFFTQDFTMESGGKQPITAKLIPLEEKPPAVATTPSQPSAPPAVMEKPPAVAGVKQPLAFETAGFDQWVKEVSALAPEQQVEEVAKKLGELNPGFDGKVTHQSADGVVTHLKFLTDEVTDVSPVRALAGLWNLDVSSNRLNGRLADLSPLNGLPLTWLSFNNTNVRDLSPLQGMPLVALGCELTHITDLSALAGMQLTFFDCYRTPVSDISVLKGMPLTTLLTQLTQVTDYSPLQGMPLDTLICDFHPKRDTELLRSLTKMTAINGQTAADFWKDVAEYSDASKTLIDPAFQQWLKDVASLTAEEQVVAVAKKLQELNPSFDGKVEHTIEAGIVSSLKFVSDKVWNIAPVRALTGLRTFDCSGSKLNGREGKVTDLSPLTGLPLTDLKCVGTLVLDLSPLKGMPLTKLEYGSGPGFDMTPLQGMPLAWLSFSLTPLSDLMPIQGLPLTYLQIDGAHTTDLTPVRGMPLMQLSLREVPVADLTPLAGMPLESLGCQSSNVTDLTQVKDLPIKYLWLDFQPARDTALLRSMTTLEYINDKPVAEFWKEVEEHLKGKGLGFQMPGFEQWVKEVSALAPEQQVEAVSKKLVELNPEFDGKVTPLIHQGVVFYLQFLTDHVTDISPVRALPSMYELRCDGSVTGEVGHGELSDLSPLKGLPLRTLTCNYTAVSDLSPLAGMPLETFQCGLTPVSDLSPLRGMPLTGLVCLRTQVSDLSPLKGMGLNHLEVQFSATSDLSPLIGMPLSYLMFHATHVTDTSPLKNLPLKHLYLDFQPERDTALLRSLKTLDMINAKPTAEFWKEVELRDAGQKQVEAFAKKMMELNPGFDGKVTPGFESGKLIRLQFLSNHVTDISPLREFQDLRELDMASTIPYGMLADLTPLKDLQLTALSIPSTRVADLSPLRGMPLAYLNCSGTRVSDLTPLVDSPLTRLSLIHTLVSDLRPLQGKQLIDLNLLFSRVADISLLRGMPLQRLTFDFRPQRDIEILKSISTLTDINNTPSTDFWKELAEYSDASKTLADPAFQQWLTDVAVLKAEEQVVAVTKKLQELNPSYDGKEEHSIDAGVVTSLKFVSDKVWNIAPVRGLTGLKTFDCSGSDADGREGKVSDLSPLSGLSLTELKCVGTLVYDLAPLKGMPLNRLDYGSGPAFDLTPLQGMPLTWLNFSLTPVSDLTPIKGLPLRYLQLDGTLVTDVTPLQGMALTQFHLRQSPVSDLTPLAGMPLGILGFQGSDVTDLTQIKDLPIKHLLLDFKPARDTALLRSMPTLEYINDKPVAEFWKEVEAGGK